MIKTLSSICSFPRQLRKAFILVVPLLAGLEAGHAFAQSVPNAEAASAGRIAQLEKMLGRITQEQQSVYQQFQMVQELRRNELQESNPLVMQGPSSMGGVRNTPPVNYDDNIRLQQEREKRIRQYGEDLDRLYARYSQLGEQKKNLIDEILTLSRDAGR